jgi:AAA+ ATPase superfamily predicted ATPase
MKNPFITNRALGAADLVDREVEVRRVQENIRQGGKLFMIGPRRFGKTSILRAACEGLEQGNIRTLMLNVQSYTSIEELIRGIIAGAATLTGNLSAGIKVVKKFFGAFNPSITISAEGSVTASLGLKTPEGKEQQAPLFIEALDRMERLTEESGKKTGLILDEFQHVLKLGGAGIEGQMRAAVQMHQHLGYVFAGSQTSLISDMVSNHARPFYRLGENLFVGPIPREEFTEFLRRGFSGLKIKPADAPLERIFDLAEDVPYNVQALARACWQELYDRKSQALTKEIVDEVHESLIGAMEPIYAPQWGNLTVSQQRALLGVARYGGQGLTGKAVLKALDLTPGTMQTSLASLEQQSILRREYRRDASAWRFEDPLFKGWIVASVKG